MNKLLLLNFVFLACNFEVKVPVATETKEVPISEVLHLKDTTFMSGNFILFLRPDSLRSLALGEIDDSDFGFGIASTMDSLEKRRDIKAEISTKRYVLIRDCKGGPLLIDRDTLDYGIIISGTGRAVERDYMVHSGDYMQEINDYFQAPVQ
jgi:hypothetical protein